MASGSGEQCEQVTTLSSVKQAWSLALAQLPHLEQWWCKVLTPRPFSSDILSLGSHWSPPQSLTQVDSLRDKEGPGPPSEAQFPHLQANGKSAVLWEVAYPFLQ